MKHLFRVRRLARWTVLGLRLGSGFGTRFEVLRTTYQSQTFARHSHDTYTLGLVLGGAGTFWCRGTERFACKGDVVVIPPGEVHTGSVGSGVDSLSYLAIYLPVGLAALHAEAAGARGGKPPEFGSVVLRDSGVRRAYQALDQAIGSDDAFLHGHTPKNADAGADFDEAAAETAACVAITELIRRHAQRHHQNDSLDQRSDRARAAHRECRARRARGFLCPSRRDFTADACAANWSNALSSHSRIPQSARPAWRHTSI